MTHRVGFFRRGVTVSTIVFSVACGGGSGGGGGGTGGGGVSPVAPTDTTTISSNASVTIGPCDTLNCSTASIVPTLQVFAAPRQDSRIACANGCPFSYTFLNHSIAVPAERGTQFVGVVPGNYEFIAQMTTPSLTVSFGSGAGMAVLSAQVIEGPNAVLTCAPFLVATFSKADGSASQNIRLIVAARQLGIPRCEGGAAVIPPVTPVPPTTTPSTSTVKGVVCTTSAPTGARASRPWSSPTR